MTVHTYLSKRIGELQDEVLNMGSLVEKELKLAFEALEDLDIDLANQVFTLDMEVNEMRHLIEQKAVTLLGMQQPMAVDLRSIMVILNMIVDLERMGDQAKSVAKAIRYFKLEDHRILPPQLNQMANLSITMLQQSLIAYQSNDIDLAREVAEQDDAVDHLFVDVFNHVMARYDADTQTAYEILRVAQAIERFGDLATNLAERAIYKVTGSFTEINVEHA